LSSFAPWRAGLRSGPLRSVARLAVALAATLVLSAVVWTGYRRHARIRFDTGTERAAGLVGVLLSSPASEPLPIHFSDGTSLSMAAATLARVTETSSQGATVVLEEGSLSCAVVHRAASRWQVAAGPYTVLVTGTQFDVRWSAAEETLALDLHEGSVTVLGPSLGATGRRVLAGESLRVSVPATPTGAPAPGQPPAPPLGQTGANPAARGDGVRIGPGDTDGTGHGSWKQLALEGRYADALATAEGEGFEATCRRASAADLLLLGETARFAGSSARAEQALRLVRARPVAKHEAAMSAFNLGRIEYDDRRNYAAAARWFQSYLREEPAGGLAREAAGRLIEAQKAAGDMSAARESASAYLAKYPAGPHAGLARTILNP
jgi:transmembrane sensor